MKITDSLSPIKRNVWWLAFFGLITTGVLMMLLSQVPQVHKTTIYFSVKPLEIESRSTQLDPAESTMKMAEAMAGWAQNPKFREEILTESGVYIPNFKRKISARKQNYMNVFWTIKLYDQDIVHQEKITQATVKMIQKHFKEFNRQNAFPYAMTPMSIAQTNSSIPLSWLWIFTIVLGVVLSLVFVYAKEVLTGRVSFAEQVKHIFPESPILSVSNKLGNHDEKLLEQYILTFDSPRLVGTFPLAERFFSLAPSEAIDPEVDTPILLVRTGSTTLEELENLKAIFGTECGIIIFNQ